MKTKQLIIKASAAFLLIILALTFFAKTIHNSMLPKVRVYDSWSGTLDRALAIYDYEFVNLNTVSIVAEGSWTVEEVFVEEGDQIEKGDLLFSVDTERYRAELLRMLAAAEALDNQLKNDGLSDENRRIIELNSYAAWREYRMLRDSFPSSGEILSDTEGTVTKIHIKKYDMLSPGADVAEVLAEESEPVVMFELSSAEHRVYESVGAVEARVRIDGRSRVESCEIIRKEKLDAGYRYFAVPTDNVTEDAEIQYFELVKRSIEYEKIVPTECVKQDPVNGAYVLTVIEERRGQTIFNRVKRIPVRVLDSQGLYTAVDFNTGTILRVVQFATEPVVDGDEVIVL